jgi:hypothetical protein
VVEQNEPVSMTERAGKFGELIENVGVGACVHHEQKLASIYHSINPLNVIYWKNRSWGAQPDGERAREDAQ